MKFFYLTVVCALAGLSVKGQTLTQANHAPAVGDTHKTYQCDSTGIQPGASGAGVSWNYATIVTHSNIAKTYTNNVYSAAAYAPADVVKFSGQTDIAYYKSTAADLKYYGGSIAISTVVATLTYSNPAIRGAYPMSLNTTSTAPTGGTVNVSVPFPVQATFTGNSKVLADGTGTLTLPGGAAGIFTNVVRVVSSQTINFTVAFPPTSGVITQVNYDYYSVGTKAPLFSITTSTVTNAALGTVTGSIVTINQDYLAAPVNPTLGLGVGENNQADVQLLVFPNPSTTFVNLTTDNQDVKEVVIYDITGKLVSRHTFIDGKLKLDVSSYSNGVYLYKALNVSGEGLKTGKLTVSH